MSRGKANGYRVSISVRPMSEFYCWLLQLLIENEMTETSPITGTSQNLSDLVK